MLRPKHTKHAIHANAAFVLQRSSHRCRAPNLPAAAQPQTPGLGVAGSCPVAHELQVAVGLVWAGTAWTWANACSMLQNVAPQHHNHIFALHTIQLTTPRPPRCMAETPCQAEFHNQIAESLQAYQVRTEAPPSPTTWAAALVVPGGDALPSPEAWPAGQHNNRNER